MVDIVSVYLTMSPCHRQTIIDHARVTNTHTTHQLTYIITYSHSIHYFKLLLNCHMEYTVPNMLINIYIMADDRRDATVSTCTCTYIYINCRRTRTLLRISGHQYNGNNNNMLCSTSDLLFLYYHVQFALPAVGYYGTPHVRPNLITNGLYKIYQHRCVFGHTKIWPCRKMELFYGPWGFALNMQCKKIATVKYTV